MCLGIHVDSVNRFTDWKLIVGLLKSGDTDTPSVILGYFDDERPPTLGVVDLPSGSYRVVFSFDGVIRGYLRLNATTVQYGSCSKQGKLEWCKFYTEIPGSGKFNSKIYEGFSIDEKIYVFRQ